MRRTHEEWARLVKEMLASGKTQKAWCAENGIKLRSMRDWLYSQKHAQSSGWVKVEPKTPFLQTQPNAAEPFEIRIGACSVKVSSGFDKTLFTEVCRALLSL
jgi:hypothetical protein